MFPILFRISDFSIPTASIVHTLAFTVGILWTYRQTRRTTIDPKIVMDLVLIILVWAIIGARIFSILFDGNLKWYLQNPNEILMAWKGGFTFYGGFIFGTLAGIWYIRKHKGLGWQITDITAPGLALGIAIGRLGCFASGDSYGKTTELPWAVIFTDSNSLAPLGIPLHPTQLYSVIINLILFGILLRWRRRTKFQGELFLVFMILYAITRFLVEIFRNDPRGVYLDGLISTSQIISIIVIFIAIVLFYFRRRQVQVVNDISLENFSDNFNRD